MMKFSLCIAALLFTALGTAAPSCAEGLAWLGGDTVRVAAHRMDLTPLPEPSNHPLLGYLARPEAPGRYPAVVVLHGCGGFGPGNVAVADALKSYGYVALALDSLGQHDACLRSGDGGLAEAFDAYAALDWLVRQNFVDPNRIALLGFSMGGFATLASVETGLGAIEKTEPRRFRSAIAFYGGCSRYGTGVMTVPTLILIGAKDDWVPVSWCRDMMARRNGKGAPVTLIVYPGARHAFNSPGPARQYLGHHLAYDPQATADAWRRVRNFLQTTLGENHSSGSAAGSR
ncbi:MAG TPA: dienelactone hydrolase family protein [Stellaceae bacterium]|nr:dienelactone hydrolase family protein [Stellaceae bacterium]